MIMKSNKIIQKGILVFLAVSIIALAVFPSGVSDSNEKTTTLTIEKSMNALYLDISHRCYDEIKITSNEKVFLVYVFNIRVAGTSGGRFNLWATPVEYGDGGTSIDLELGDLPDGCVMGSSYILIDSRGGGEDRDLQFAVVAMFKAGDEKWEVINPKVSIDNLLLALRDRLSYWSSPAIRLTVEEQLLSESQFFGWLDVLPKQIKIGVVISGGWHWGDQILRFAEDDINQYCVNEGLNYDFEFVVENAYNSEEQHLWEVQRFDGLGLNLLIGGYWSGQAQQSLDYVNSRDMLLISPSSTAPELAIPDDNLFRLSPSGEEEARVITQMLETHPQGIEAVLVLLVDDMYAWSSAESIKAALDEIHTIDLLEIVSYNRELEDIDGSLLEAENKVAASSAEDVAVVYLGFDEVVDVVRRVSEDFPALYDTTWFSWESTAFNHRLIEEEPEIAEHLKMFSPLARPDQTLFDELAARYSTETGRDIDPNSRFYVANEYDSCWLYAKAIIAAETSETEPVKAVLPAIAETHPGVSGPIYINENGDRRLVDYDIWGCGYVNGDVEWIPYGEYIAETGDIEWFFSLSDDFEDGDFTDDPTWLIDYTHSGDPDGSEMDLDPPTLMTDHTNYFEGQGTSPPRTGWLYTSNPTNVGSWQFDSRITLANDGYNNLILGGDHTFWDGSLYTVYHDWNGGNPRIRFLIDFPWMGSVVTLIDAGEGYELDRWYTIKITRDSDGNWELFVDGVSKGTKHDETYTQLDWLGIGRYGGFDNVIVYPP
ncbi:MAG: ABC transporter substrate-binding protein [Candidatus Bathyarchaeota archaeon]|nr:ABC transporter substrate-binding protein [Candidatus Bathyarchaeota archaeon]